MKKNYTFLLAGMMSVGGYTVKADNYTDINEYYLINSGFDANFNYDKSYSGNVSGNIINEVYGWDKDMTSTYTVAGTFEYGANATFNSSKTIPATGYKGSEGGAIAFTTGWGQILNYSQQVSLMKGTYKIISSYYNLGTATAGNSNLGWVPNSGTTVKSAVNSFPVNDWIGDTITFTVNSATNGKIQIGFASSNVSSANNAKVIVDYVKVLFQGDVDKSNLVTLIASAEKTYGDGSGNTAAELLSIINSAKSINENEEADILAVLGAVKSLEDGIYNYNMNNASNDNPLDITSLIQIGRAHV